MCLQASPLDEALAIDRGLTVQRIFTMFLLYAVLASMVIGQKNGFSPVFALPAKTNSYVHPRALRCMCGKVPNQVSVFLQAPANPLHVLPEILASIAGIEYAYMKASKLKKSLIMAVYLSTVSVGAIIAVAFSLLTVDPRLTWMYYITLGIETLAAGAVLH
ncbi:hypothetical protein CISG_04916 [Coccidioides immitis RMSCC 3703]|uniref:Uncharacterized protein n=1 Tax=Coccidioides immitis RMSCC 3703 TaxID=454286 RepID=A0A0J8TPU0_COCIT|nr:hypothetical protein CISG_04916 [Coccidioides immitis RMSCC 3703]